MLALAALSAARTPTAARAQAHSRTQHCSTNSRRLPRQTAGHVGGRVDGSEKSHRSCDSSGTYPQQEGWALGVVTTHESRR